MGKKLHLSEGITLEEFASLIGITLPKSEESVKPILYGSFAEGESITQQLVNPFDFETIRLNWECKGFIGYKNKKNVKK